MEVRMSTGPESHRQNLILSLVTAVLAIIAAVGGIFGNVYQEDTWFLSQMVGQDVFTLVVAASLLILPFIKTKKIKIIQAGFLAYIAYTYIFYAFGVKFNVLFLVYVALSSLSVLGLIIVFGQLAHFELKDSKGWALKGSSIYIILACLILAFLWLGDIISRLGGKPILDTPTSEPLILVYVLDLGFVIPAGLYGAIQSLRKKFWGYIITAVMLVMIATMGFALMAMTIGHYAYGFGLQGFLAVFWCVLGTLGLLLAVFYLRSLRI
jgi:hypothetical protein